MNTSPYIFKTLPHLVPKIWGGRRLERLFGKVLPAGVPVGEAWEVADLDEGQSRAATGPLAGLELRALSRHWRRELVGKNAPEADRFPLLVKLLDAQTDLSVQVHPGKVAAREFFGARSKEESWLILDSQPGGAIIHGLSQDGVDEKSFRAALTEKRVEGLLERVAVKPGDIVHVRPGTIHAICAGVALLEIQEPSDTTYRVYDYERPGLDGKPRRLHLDEALRVARLERSEQVVLGRTRVSGPVSVLVSCERYRVEELRMSKPAKVLWKVDPDSAQIVHVLSGSIVLEDGIGQEVRLEAFETAVVPAFHGVVRGRVEEQATLVASALAVESVFRGVQITLTPPVEQQ